MGRSRKAPTVSIDEDHDFDDGQEAEMSASSFKELIKEAVAEQTTADRDSLIEAICASIIEDIKCQVVSPEVLARVITPDVRATIFAELNKTLHAQSQNIIEQATYTVSDKLKENMETRQLSTKAKVGLALGAVLLIGGTYYFGRRNGMKIAHLELG
jgi:hypothetical protein